MKQYTTDTAHIHRHVRRNGTVVYVTTAHRDRLYKRGAMPPNYPVPALLQDSCSDLAERWSSWMDTDRSFGHKY